MRERGREKEREGGRERGREGGREQEEREQEGFTFLFNNQTLIPSPDSIATHIHSPLVGVPYHSHPPFFLTHPLVLKDG